MSVAFRSLAPLAFGTRTNSTITKPTGTVNDDILFAFLVTVTALSVTAPVGWTEYTGSPFTAFSGQRYRTYWKRAASEGANWTWTHTSGQTVATVSAYSGAITTGDPNDCTPTSNTGGSDGSVVALSITTATANSLGIIGWIISTASGTITPPAGFTERGDVNNVTGLQDGTIVSTGATGNKTITTSSNNLWSNFFTAFKQPTAAVPTLSSITPSSGYANTTLTGVALVGTNMNTGSPVINVPVGWTAANLNVSSATNATFDLTIPVGATVGTYNISFSTVNGTSGNVTFTVTTEESPVRTSICVPKRMN